MCFNQVIFKYGDECNPIATLGSPVHHALLARRACHVCIYVDVYDSPANDDATAAAVSFYGALNRVGGLGKNDNAVGVTE